MALPKPRPGCWHAALTLCLAWPPAAQAQVPCETIRFKPGASSAEVRGQVPVESGQCLQFSSGKGQTVRVSVRSPHDQVAFSIDGLVDNRSHYQFRSENRRYQLFMHQTFKAVAPVEYVLSLSIK